MNINQLRILASHPVQYHVPFFRALVASGLNIEVGYYHSGTAGKIGRDLDFGLDIQWDIDLLSDYPHRIFNSDLATYGRSEQLRYFLPMTAWALKERTPILLMGWFIESVWLIWMLALLYQIPVLVLCETTPLSYAATPKPAWRTRLLGWLMRHTHAGLFIGTQNRNFLVDMGMPENRLFPTPYSIDTNRFSSEAGYWTPQRTSLCALHGLDADMPTFLFSGKLIAKKRPLELLEAYCSAGLSDKAQLIFVGDGRLRLELEQRIQDLGLKHVHLLGFLNQSQMPLAYVLGEVLCLISDPTETWGLVVNEALACGRPVIVSASVGCAPDLVAAENGWVVPLDDLPALTNTLRLAYEHRASWRQMGTAGREKISRHTFSQMVAGVNSALATM